MKRKIEVVDEPTTIHALPEELIVLILEETSKDKYNLFAVADLLWTCRSFLKLSHHVSRHTTHVLQTLVKAHVNNGSQLLYERDMNIFGRTKAAFNEMLCVLEGKMDAMFKTRAEKNGDPHYDGNFVRLVYHVTRFVNLYSRKCRAHVLPDTIRVGGTLIQHLYIGDYDKDINLLKKLVDVRSINGYELFVIPGMHTTRAYIKNTVAKYTSKLPVVHVEVVGNQLYSDCNIGIMARRSSLTLGYSKIQY